MTGGTSMRHIAAIGSILMAATSWAHDWIDD